MSGAPLEVLQHKRVVVVGYGNQGRAHALNLKESGLQVSVWLREGSARLETVRRDGLFATTDPQAVADAKLVIIALPDEAHAAFCPRLTGVLSAGSVVGFMHGFSVHYKCVEFPPEIGVVMVAPKGPGVALRQRFVEGMGIPALLAVHQGGTNPAEARQVATAWAHGIGCGRAGIIETTFREETETDLFGEQVVLCGGLTRLIYEAYQVLVEAGYPPLLAYTECCHEVKQIADLICDRGIAGMEKAISSTAHFGALDAGPKVISAQVRTRMQEVLGEIQSGAFAKRMIADSEQGGRRRAEGREASAMHPIEIAGRQVRAMLPWLKGGESQPKES